MVTDTFDSILSELAAERARYEDFRTAGRVLDAIASRSALHTLRAKIADIQPSWNA